MRRAEGGRFLVRRDGLRIEAGDVLVTKRADDTSDGDGRVDIGRSAERREAAPAAIGVERIVALARCAAFRTSAHAVAAVS